MAKKAESTLVNMLVSLTAIALVASLALALVNNATKGPIEEVNKKKIAEAVAKVLPAYDNYTIDTVQVTTPKGSQPMVRYTAVDANGAVVGKALEAWDDNGFGGKISAMVGFDAEGAISGYEILSSAETPGLGAKADKWFQKDGKGNVIGMQPGQADLKVKKDGGQVDAITGSTITSRAFCRLVQLAYQAFQL
ncbi:MAG: RnfABCDGE type electron transport complex subunit G [Bacteroidales bacterium]|nr:RnfABCDGE type electron transport complex subunit G [Bacteroidales bacterium]